MKTSFFKQVHKHLPNRIITEKEKEISQSLTAAASASQDDLFERLGTQLSGLTVEEAAGRLKSYGGNTVAYEKMKPWYIQFLLAFKNPFNFVLLTLAVISFLTGDYTGMTLIIVMVFLSVIIKFTQEYKSRKGAEALRKMVHTLCTVVRPDANGQPTETDIPLEELVPGDIIRLAAGDIIPADVRILHSKNLFISQSALTGESLPIEKESEAVPAGSVSDTLELKNICFMGTNVDVGTGTAVVLSTGVKTYFGSMAENLISISSPTSFDIGIKKVSWLLIQFMIAMVPVVFFISGFTKGNWVDALMFALAVAVGLTPEMLPVVVTSNLAKGAMRMAREKVIVKKLSAIQDFGAMDMLCTDKTGTLTEDRIVLMKYTDIYLDESLKALRYAYLNSYFETGLKNVMDKAILDNTFLPDKSSLEKEWQAIDELPFDFVRRRMSVVLKNSSQHILICKGAVEEMLSAAATVDTPGGEIPLTPELKQTIIENAGQLNRDGLRVITVGHRFFPSTHSDTYTIDDESGLILDGFMSFLDPPKESARKAIDELTRSGIRMMVLTGDNEIITKKVCSEVGLVNERIILGSDLEPLTDPQATDLIEQHHIFAKLSPLQKARIVRLMRERGHIVGYMGDGINDAVSLREADIGISVDTAVNIAKENADIILLKKNLLVLNKGVIEGRKMFANTMKYIKITASSNFGNVFSMLGASALFPFLPMLPLQILVLNLLYDISQTAIPWDNVDPEYLTKPRKWIAGDIRRFMLIVGPISSIFDYATFAILFFVFGANTVENQAIFQTGWFMESLFTQTLVVQVLRTEKIPFVESNSSRQLMVTALILLIAGISLPYTGLGRQIGFRPIPPQFYYWLAAVLLAYCILAQLVKRWYIKRYKSWL